MIAVLGMVVATQVFVRSRSWRQYQEASRLVDEITQAEFAELARLREALRAYPAWSRQLLQVRFAEATPQSPERTRLALLADQGSGRFSEIVQAIFAVAPPDRTRLLDLLSASDREAVIKFCTEVLANEQELVARRFLAANMLVHLGCTDAELWKRHARMLVRQMVWKLIADPEGGEAWLVKFQPIARYLNGELFAMARATGSPTLSADRIMAIDRLVAVFGSESPEAFADLIFELEPSRRAHILDRIQFRREILAKWAEGRLPGTSPSANAAPVLGETTHRLIEQADGLLTSRFALCQSLKPDDWSSLTQALESSGYRPRQRRPYRVGQPSGDVEIRMACLWTRDAVGFVTEIDLDGEQLKSRVAELETEGFAIVDVWSYVPAAMPSERANVRYAAVWVTRDSLASDTELHIDLTRDQHRELATELRSAAKTPRMLQQLWLAPEDSAYCEIWEQGSSGWRLKWGSSAADVHGDVVDGMTLTDAGAFPVDVAISPDAEYRRQIEVLQTRLKEAPDDAVLAAAASIVRARLAEFEHRYEDARVELDQALLLQPEYQDAYQFRAVVHALLGNAAEANQDLTKYLERATSQATELYVTALVTAYLGEADEALNALEKLSGASSSGVLYNIACVLSLMAERHERTDPMKAESLADRSLSFLEDAVRFGYTNFSHMNTDRDLHFLHGRLRFNELLSLGDIGWMFRSVAVPGDEWDTELLRCNSHSEHHSASRQLAAIGFEPMSISIDVRPDNGERRVLSAWRRARLRTAENASRARRWVLAAWLQAKAGDAELQDPTVQSVLAPLPENPASRQKQFKHLDDGNVALVAATLLSLGASANGVTLDVRTKVLDLYRTHPSPEVHGAARWLLVRWDMAEDRARIEREIHSDTPLDDRQWYVTASEHTMVVFEGPIGFQMGSMARQPVRGSDEHAHFRRIDRSYSIADREVTQQQFARFLSESGFSVDLGSRPISVEPTSDTAADLPQVHVTWYAAAAYCNWLSAQTGLSQDQWCYLPNDEGRYGDGMKIPGDAALRRGFRLPTEAEWEFACTARRGLNADELLSESTLSYVAWYAENSGWQAHPCGDRRPGPHGLFDMLGNVWEWCHDEYSTDPRLMADHRRGAESVNPIVSRSLRGGSFTNVATDLRAQERALIRPGRTSATIGFRVARTEAQR